MIENWARRLSRSIVFVFFLIFFCPKLCTSQIDAERIWQVNPNIFTNLIVDIAISNLQDRAAVIFENGTFQLIDSRNGLILEEYDLFDDFGIAGQVVFSADDSEIIFLGSGKLGYWSVKEKKFRLTCNAHSSFRFDALAISSNGKYIFSGTSDGLISVWKYAESSPFKEYNPGPNHSLNSIASIDEKGAVCFCLDDGIIFRWDFELGTPPSRLCGKSNGDIRFGGVSYQKNLGLLHIVTDSVYTFDLANGTLLTHMATPYHANSGLFDYIDNVLYLSSGGDLITIDLTSYTAIEQSNIFNGTIELRSIFGQGKLIVKYDFVSFGTYDIKNQKAIPFILPIAGSITDFHYYLKKDQLIASTSDAGDGELVMLNRIDGSIATLWKGVGNAIKSFSVSNTYDKLLTADRDHQLRVWNMQIGTLETVLNTDGLFLGAEIIRCEITDDAKYAIVIFTDSTLRIWDIEQNNLIHTYKSPLTIQTVAISDKFIALGAESYVTLFNIPTWDSAYSFLTIGNGNKMIQFSQDGRYCSAGTAVFDLYTLTREYYGYGGYFVLMPDNKREFTADFDSPIYIFDLALDSVLYIYQKFANRIKFLTLSPDANSVAAASPSGTIALLRNMIPPLKTVRTTRNFSSNHWRINTTFNPDKIYWISNEKMPETSLKIYGVTGLLIHEQLLLGNNSTDGYNILLHTKGLSEGMYIISLQNSKEVYALKFFVNK